MLTERQAKEIFSHRDTMRRNAFETQLRTGTGRPMREASFDPRAPQPADFGRPSTLVQRNPVQIMADRLRSVRTAPDASDKTDLGLGTLRDGGLAASALRTDIPLNLRQSPLPPGPLAQASSIKVSSKTNFHPPYG